jgi:hypothetical protein
LEGLSKPFRAYDPEQVLLMSPVLAEWVPQGDLAHFVSDLVEDALDLSAIYASYDEARGFPPYDPRLMVKLLVYGYANGVCSSRKLERATHRDVAIRMLRRFVLRHQARRPGRIQVTLTHSDDCADSAALTARLRERLSQDGMVAWAAVPGAAASTGFLDVLAGVRIDINQPLQGAAELLRLACPRHAWEIRVTLLTGNNDPRHGVAVEVINLSRRSSSLRTIWEDSWVRAVELAAHHAIGDILPQTRLCRKTPWVAWYGRRIPGELLDHHHHARELLRDRRYDEALGVYYEALQIDPHNPS